MFSGESQRNEACGQRVKVRCRVASLNISRSRVVRPPGLRKLLVVVVVEERLGTTGGVVVGSNVEPICSSTVVFNDFL